PGYEEPGCSDREEPALPGYAEPEPPGRAEPARPGCAEPGSPGCAEPARPGYEAPGCSDREEPALPGYAEPGHPDHAGPGSPGCAAPARPANGHPPVSGEPGRPGYAGPARPATEHPPASEAPARPGSWRSAPAWPSPTQPRRGRRSAPPRPWPRGRRPPLHSSSLQATFSSSFPSFLTAVLTAFSLPSPPVLFPWPWAPTRTHRMHLWCQGIFRVSSVLFSICYGSSPHPAPVA